MVCLRDRVAGSGEDIVTPQSYPRYVGFFFGDEGFRVSGVTSPQTQVKSVGAPNDRRAQEWGETTAAEYGWRLLEVCRFDDLPPLRQDFYRRMYGWEAVVHRQRPSDSEPVQASTTQGDQ